MTLDEAIQHAEDKSKEIYIKAMLCHANPDDGELDKCIECAKEHEQLAEWLKEYREMKLYHVPVVHGKWIAQYVSTRGLTDVFSCSNCNVSVRLLHKKVKCSYKYCPYCGAKMEE